MKSSRRKFIKNSGLALGALPLINTKLFGMNKNEKKIQSIGFQSWTLKDKLMEDFSGTLKMMSGLGYDEVEMCSPLGYSKSGFGHLGKYSGTELRKLIEDSGLMCKSSHYQISELRDSLDDRIDWAHQMGMTQMMLAIFGLPKDASMDDFRRSANELNKIAEKTKKAGLQMGFHNHHVEFAKIDDVLIYDVLLEELDPELVKLQFQVAVVDIGYNAADYFRNNPGRFISAHLADWSKEKNGQVPVGQGVVDWEDFFEAAKIGGVKNVFVEMSPEKFDESAQFLLSL